MKKIYLMRHGQTLFNIMELNQGQCDSPLTEAGKQQALAAKKWYTDHHITFDSVYCSTAERACDTTELITSQPYTRLKGLKEIFLGTKEATTFDENPPYPYGDFFVKYGGEDLDEFTDRIHGTVKKIADEDQGDTILVVSHGMAIQRFLTAISYLKNVNEYLIIGNCGIIELTYDNDTFTVDQIINVEQ